MSQGLECAHVERLEMLHHYSLLVCTKKLKTVKKQVRLNLNPRRLQNVTHDGNFCDSKLLSVLITP